MIFVISNKHWIDSLGWGMVDVMYEILLEVTKATFVIVFFIAINANKVTTIDNIK
jgi:hypothetical protein